jgi:hypothetical protein
MKKASAYRSNRPFRLFAGWIGLMLYLFAFSPVGMGVVALLGTMDIDHHVYFQPAANGMRLLLHHEAICASHKHHAVARALNIVAQPASETDPDHVVQFAGGDSFIRETQLAAEGQDSATQPTLDCDFSFVFSDFRRVISLPPTGPPPDFFGNLLNIRSTVLLI